MLAGRGIAFLPSVPAFLTPGPHPEPILDVGAREPASSGDINAAERSGRKIAPGSRQDRARGCAQNCPIPGARTWRLALASVRGDGPQCRALSSPCVPATLRLGSGGIAPVANVARPAVHEASALNAMPATNCV